MPALSLDDVSFEGWSRGDLALAFAGAWAALALILIALDWLGNPNRGRFRPQGPERGRGLVGRWRTYRRSREDADAQIRETLRTAYGKSSLRLRWSKLDETTATAHDESRLEPVPRLLELGAVAVKRRPLLATDRDDGWGRETPAADDPPERPDPSRRWSVGLDPRMPTPQGRKPTRQTIRSRFWKNAARHHGAHDEANRERMAAGKPPRRWNPVSGRIDTATVSIGDLEVRWPLDGVDPFVPAGDPDPDDG